MKMYTLSKLIIFQWVALFTWSGLSVANLESQTAEYQKQKSLLENYGFSQEFQVLIDKNIANNSQLKSSSITQANKERMSVFKTSGEIAARVLSAWALRPDGPSKYEDAQRVVQTLLKQKILKLDARFTFELGAGVNLDENLKKLLTKRILAEVDYRFSDLLLMAYGEDQAKKMASTTENSANKELYTLLLDYTNTRYNHLEIAQTPYLGKALLLGVINHYYESTTRTSAIAHLDASLKADSLISKTSKEILEGKVQKVLGAGASSDSQLLKLYDIVLTKSKRLEPFVPADSINYQILFAKADKESVNALTKMGANEAALVICRAPDPKVCSPSNETGLKINWLVEAPVFPSGGTRIVDLNQYAPVGWAENLVLVHWNIADFTTNEFDNTDVNSLKLGTLIAGAAIPYTKIPGIKEIDKTILSPLSVSLQLTPWAPQLTSRRSPKIIVSTDYDIFARNSFVTTDAVTSPIILPLIEKVQIANYSANSEPFAISDISMSIIKDYPSIKAKLKAIETSQEQVGSSFSRTTIQCKVGSKLSNSNDPAVTTFHEPSMKQFLYQLGFGDKYNNKWLPYHEIMKAYLDDPSKYINEMTKRQQERNIVDYAKVNDSVELATFIFKQLNPCEPNDKFIHELVSFIASISLFEAPIALEQNGNQAESGITPEAILGKEAYYSRSLRMRMAEEAENLVTIIVDSLYGEKIKSNVNNHIDKDTELTKNINFIREKAKPITELAFMNHQIGRTKFLGRALMALFLRYSELNNLDAKQSFETLNKALASYSIDLHNFIGDEWYLHAVDDETKIESITKFKMYNLNYVFTRGISMESPTIPSGALPARDDIGRDMGLVGSYIAAPLFYSAEGGEGTYSKADNWREKNFYTQFNKGYSHIGYGVVREAYDSKIKMTWVIDNYPAPIADAEANIAAPYNPGGIRISGLEQYFRPDHQSQLGVVNMFNMNPDLQPGDVKDKLSTEKFYAFFKYAKTKVSKFVSITSSGEIDTTNVDTKAFQYAYEAYAPQLDEWGKPLTLPQLQAKGGTAFMRDDWLVDISYKDYLAMHAEVIESLKCGDSKECLPKPAAVKTWYDRVNRAALHKIYDLMYNGVIFVWITPYGQYFKGAAYCSFTGALAWKLATGLDIEDQPDKWDDVVQTIPRIKDDLIKQFGPSAQLENLAMLHNMFIVSPSGIAAQPYNVIRTTDQYGKATYQGDMTSFIPTIKFHFIRTKQMFGRSLITSPHAETTEKFVRELTHYDLGSYFDDAALDPTEIRANFLDTNESLYSKLVCRSKGSYCQGVK